MIQATDLRVNTLFEYNDEPCRVLSYKHTHMARGSADVRLKIRGLVTGNVIPLTFAPSDRFEEVSLVKKPMQFLYKEDEALNFMDPQTFEQIEIEASQMGDEIAFLQDGETYNVLYWDEKPLSIEIPPKVVVEILECDPGVKGNSAANMYKDATVTGGIKIRVPLFIKQGEKIRVSTEDRAYVERAK
ncbi:elongation factor P [Candidatus Beckwithbacteria bacterium]|nr:elongation factor P [Candidatus Beckwithbacteria bacterium]